MRNQSEKVNVCGVIQFLRGHYLALFLTPYLPLWTFSTAIVDKNRHFWTSSYPPHLVHVVIEGPRRRNLAAKIIGAEQVAVF